MAPVASYLTVNISSPNTPGLRDLQAPDALDALLKRIQAAPASPTHPPPTPLDALQKRIQAALASLTKRPPLLVKLAPDIAEDVLPEIVSIIVANGADGIVVSNTTLSRDGLKHASFARESGGLSGRPLFARSTRMLARVYRLTEGRLPLIGFGGIDSGEAALAKIAAGASLIQLYTGLVFEGLVLIGRIKQALLAGMERAKADSLVPLIGSRAEEWASRRGAAAT